MLEISETKGLPWLLGLQSLQGAVQGPEMKNTGHVFPGRNGGLLMGRFPEVPKKENTTLISAQLPDLNVS